jgi:hypothetical protein
MMFASIWKVETPEESLLPSLCGMCLLNQESREEEKVKILIWFKTSEF